MSSSRAYFRAAKPEDKPTVFRFTRHTYEHGDYIRFVWRDWIKNPRGRLLVSTINRQPVAVAHVALLSPTEAWFEGLRVDPAFRRFGLATGLTGFSLKTTLRLKASVLRFITSSGNIPIHVLSAKLGFAKIAVIQSYQSLPDSNSNSPLIKASLDDMRDLSRFIAGSQLMKSMHGLYGSGWQFQALDQTQIEARVKAGQVLLVRRPGVLQAVAVVEKRLYDKTLVICYADGFKSALIELVSGIRQKAARQKLAAVSARLPVNNSLISIFETAGFQASPDENYWIFEKYLEGSGEKPE